MGLKDLQIVTTIVKTPGGDLAVRGLSLDGIVQLVRRNRPAMEDLFKYVKFTAEGRPEIDSGTSVALSLLDLSPDLAAEIIAVGAGDGDEESISLAKGLVAGAQIAALEAIGALTFQGEGGVKKVVETLVSALRGIAAPLAASDQKI